MRISQKRIMNRDVVLTDRLRLGGGGVGGGLTYKTSKEDQCGCGSSLN